MFSKNVFHASRGKLTRKGSLLLNGKSQYLSHSPNTQSSLGHIHLLTSPLFLLVAGVAASIQTQTQAVCCREGLWTTETPAASPWGTLTKHLLWVTWHTWSATVKANAEAERASLRRFVPQRPHCDYFFLTVFFFSSLSLSPTRNSPFF